MYKVVFSSNLGSTCIATGDGLPENVVTDIMCNVDSGRDFVVDTDEDTTYIIFKSDIGNLSYEFAGIKLSVKLAVRIFCRRMSELIDDLPTDDVVKAFNHFADITGRYMKIIPINAEAVNEQFNSKSPWDMMCMLNEQDTDCERAYMVVYTATDEIECLDYPVDCEDRDEMAQYAIEENCDFGNSQIREMLNNIWKVVE